MPLLENLEVGLGLVSIMASFNPNERVLLSLSCKCFWESNKLAMGHFTTVNRAMHFHDGAKGIWKKKNGKSLNSLAGTFLFMNIGDVREPLG